MQLEKYLIKEQVAKNNFIENDRIKELNKEI
jgi:hypothetical protein